MKTIFSNKRLSIACWADSKELIKVPRRKSFFTKYITEPYVCYHLRLGRRVLSISILFREN